MKGILIEKSYCYLKYHKIIISSKIINQAIKVIIIILLFATSLTLFGCRKQAINNSNQNTEKIFRMNISSEPPTLDWTLATDNVSFHVITNIMEGLTQFDDKLNPVPAIARKWEASEDGRTITFFLRDNIFWTDGKPVTAYDFEYSWKRLLNPKTGAEYAYFLYDLVNAYEYNSGIIKDSSLVGVRAKSDKILEVRLKNPVVYFPSLTTFMVTFPLRKEIIEKFGDRWTEPEHIVSNGPFKLDKWEHEYKLELVSNRKYYGDIPKIGRIKMFVVGENNTALTLYETNDMDMVNIPPLAISYYRNSKEYIHYPQLRGYYYGFNVRKKPFDDVMVRKAFTMAIDRTKIVELLKGGELPVISWIPEGMFGYNKGIGINFNPDSARKLLSEAGYPQGKNFPTVTIAFNTDSENKLIAENIQSQIKKNLNIDVILDNQEWKVYLKNLKTNTPQIFRLGWGADYPDPDNFMNLFTTHSGNNNTGWGNAEYDRLISIGTKERDRTLRAEIYNKAQKILCEEDIPIMPLFVAAQNILLKNKIKGFKPNAMDILYLKKVSIN